MRLLTTILTLYIFAMSLQLCGDCFRDLEHERDSKTVSVTILLDDTDDSAGCCAFSCCQGYACEERAPLPASDAVVSKLISPTVPLWDTDYHRNHSKSIWQPPKA
jgi:hypothetical protein